MFIKLRSCAAGKHVHEQVFTGPDKDHLALAGNLRFELGEWQLFGTALMFGASRMHGGQLEVVTEGDDRVVVHFHEQETQTAPGTTDESWADLARSTRDALALLGYPIGDRCLPDEPDPCGATFAQHTAAHLGKIGAAAAHHAAHLGARFDTLISAVYRDAETEFSSGHFCDVEGGPACGLR